MTLSKSKAGLIRRLRTSKLRAREAAFIVEGIRGVGEFLVEAPTSPDRSGTQGPLSAGPVIRWALVSPRLQTLSGGVGLLERLGGGGIAVEEVTDAELASVSDTERHQGVLLVADEPALALSDLAAVGPLRLLLLDGVQDPGNAGTLLRASAAFGVDGVVALDGTVDLFQPKVVRASAGVLARLPSVRAPWSDVAPWLEGEGIMRLVADRSGMPALAFQPPDRWGLIIGNEGAGPRPEVLDGAQGRLGIPMRGPVESLNAGVAGAILLFALDQTSQED